MLRCKLVVRCVEVVKDSDGNVETERVFMEAVHGEDGTPNGEWSKFTPAANFSITITNPRAFGRLPEGAEVMADLTLCAGLAEGAQP